LRQESREIFDALGLRQQELYWNAAVNHTLARELPRATAEAAGAMPVERRGDLVVVAIANPLDESSVRAVEDALRAPLLIQVVERQMLENAHRRVWRSASLGERLLQAGLIGSHDL